MSDALAWLRAQLDDDERVAREAPGPDWHRAIEREGKPGYWRSIKAELVTLRPDRPQDSLSVGDEVARSGDYRVAEHIARWDPARVLAEIEAKRRILDAYEWGIAHPNEDQETGRWVRKGANSALEDTVRLLAQPYADRPGFPQEWR